MVCWILLILSCVSVHGLQVNDMKQNLENAVYEMQKVLRRQTLYITKLEKRLEDQEVLISTQAEILKSNQRKLERLDKTVLEQKELILDLLKKSNEKNTAEKQDVGKDHTASNSLIYSEHNQNGSFLSKSINLSRQTANNERLILRPKRALVADTGVAFYAYLTTEEKDPGPGHTLIFRTVVTNAGNYYNHHNGIFTSPGHGVYVFSWTISVWDYIGTEVLVNSHPIGAMYTTAYDVPDIRTTTGVVVVMLNENDVVFVRVNGNSTIPRKGHIFSDSHYKTSFCGWKLF
ncbi:uncharacterized protein LOC134235630 [Saccostrea cucullata]|uniref:uncharacterized protein LOC134235630 n=1 Tax=Saccostrea cuccullata TaxID=36930 RepID=UPI002ED53FDF